MSKVIFHIDMNAFFVSCEINMDPSLKGKPVAIGSNYKRSVISTSSYEARKYGVHSAQPVHEALKLCPDLILVKPHFDIYSKYSKMFLAIVHRYTDLVEQASIDECYADMSQAILKEKKPLDLAWKLQKEIYEECHLPCSIGVAPNKFLAKMGSDMKKPMGITVIRYQEVEAKLWPLEIGDMYGVGKKSAAACRNIGINTIGDLANITDFNMIKSIFGKNCQNVVERAKGYDNDVIITEHDVKSISNSTTLNDDTTDDTEIRSVIAELSKNTILRLNKQNMCGNLISIQLKYYDFKTTVKSRKIATYIDDYDSFYEQIMNLYDEIEGDIPIRLVGVGIGNLKEKKNAPIQMDLFTYNNYQEDQTAKLIHDINVQVKGAKIMTASELTRKDRNR